jgi:mutator protein MutT
MKEVSAGGVVFSRTDDQLKIMLIEDRYGKWSLPKGKIEKGETPEETALREIREETGIIGKIIEPLETIYYQYFHPSQGSIDKEVHFFLVEKMDGKIQVQIEEIRSVHWLDPMEAWRIQSESGYENNHNVIRKAFHRLNINIG